MLDMDRQIKPVRGAVFVLMAVALLACVPWMSWSTLVPLPIIAATYEGIAPRLQRARHPEYLLFVGWSVAQVLIAVSVAVAGGPRLAESLRRAVAERPCGGHRVTMSFGVAASDGDGFDYDAVFAAADRALYQAKRGGRDCVCSSGSLARAHAA